MRVDSPRYAGASPEAARLMRRRIAAKYATRATSEKTLAYGCIVVAYALALKAGRWRMIAYGPSQKPQYAA
jgi:hypothetical protein